MTDLEKLLRHSLEQNMALVKATAMLAIAAQQLASAADTIARQQSENELLRADLAAARAGLPS